MRTEEATNYVAGYLNWLKNNLRVSDAGNSAVISTPFLDRHNDEIEIYVQKQDDKLRMTDDGYTVRDLRTGGIDISKGARHSHLLKILNGFGVSLENEELVVVASERDFGQKKHNLLQAILAVDDLFVTAKEHVLQFFREDVEAWLRLKNVPMLRDIKLSGQSGFDHHFDIALPSTRTQPERVLQTINSLRRDSVTSLAFSVQDVRNARGGSQLGAFAMINDSDKDALPENVIALEKYGIKPLLWSRREEQAEELLAA
jgi:hypothetical protein